MSEEKIFIPHELKTIEVDTEKKIFLVNGEPFGRGCTAFSISCEAEKGYRVCMEIETTIQYVEYDEEGRRKSTAEYPALREINTEGLQPGSIQGLLSRFLRWLRSILWDDFA